MVSSHLPRQNNTFLAGELSSAYSEPICIGMRAFDPDMTNPLDPADTAVTWGGTEGRQTGDTVR